MNTFLTPDFLLNTETARHLYHDYAAPLPIIDYHCHLSPREIYEDRQFETITQLWLEADHYKWRLMRWAGVEERYITGDANDREKFQKWADTLGLAIGNPLYHWSHLELRNYFGYEGILNGDTAQQVWALCNQQLQQPELSARNLLIRSHVTALCTTDDPADSLEWHQKLAEEGFPIQVLPSFRPDKAFAIESDDYLDYLQQLGSINCFEDLVNVLFQRLKYFKALGCRVTDHGMTEVPYAPAADHQVSAVFRKRLNGQKLTPPERSQFKTALLLALGRQYAREGLVMQLHFGVIRNNAKRLFLQLGPDCGIDSIGDPMSFRALAGFLNALDETNELPKTILYSLNPNDNAAIETLIGAFQNGGTVSKLQHGSAWWFNDQKPGMTDHLISLANYGYLAGFVGMVTDSRSFLSYARHEYFRRILCQTIGSWVEAGEFPKDETALRTIIQGISMNNARNYLSLN